MTLNSGPRGGVAA